MNRRKPRSNVTRCSCTGRPAAAIQVAHAIGMAQPVSVKVDTSGTGDLDAAAAYVRTFDVGRAAIAERLGLLRPVYRGTTNYGHFGKPELPWGSSALRLGPVPGRGW